MYKIIFALSLVLAAAKGYVQDISSAADVYHVDDYINWNRQQHAKALKHCDTELEDFREYYFGRVKGIHTLSEFLISSIVENEKHFSPYLVLSDFDKECVVKYGSAVPTVPNTENAINKCVLKARNEIANSLTRALNTRKELENYYANYFEKSIENCANEIVNTTDGYISCVFDVSSKTDTYTIISQKKFKYDMEAAACSAEANTKRAYDCNYDVHHNTTAEIASAKLLIDNCMFCKEKCKYCNDILKLPEYHLQNETMHNPLHLRSDNPKCLLLTRQVN